MTRATLYLLRTGFTDSVAGDGEFFCPHCIEVEGMMAAFPVIRQNLDVNYVGFQKPRGSLAQYVGDASQSCPQLILLDGDDEFSHGLSHQGIGNSKKIEGATEIQEYLIQRFDLPRRHP